MIIDERMSAFIDSLDSGNPAWLNEIEKVRSGDTGSHHTQIHAKSAEILLNLQAEEHPGSWDCYGFLRY